MKQTNLTVSVWVVLVLGRLLDEVTQLLCCGRYYPRAFPPDEFCLFITGFLSS